MGVRVNAADRQILRHPLHEPERRLDRASRVELSGQSPCQKVELERMDQLMGQHVLEVGVRAGERQDHAALGKLRDTSRPFRDQAGQRVGLLKLRVRGVEDDRLPAFELVAEQAAQTRVCSLSHAGRVPRRLALARIVVDIEVGGT